ncbi:MAG: PP2C family serine/threonine-protein phosphatase [Cardiobacteriaceae bacterium]|nr:PP2C family serine/threonine-protein phosphatase [Cardiobacteriaceae bacterium]
MNHKNHQDGTHHAQDLINSLTSQSALESDKAMPLDIAGNKRDSNFPNQTISSLLKEHLPNAMEGQYYEYETSFGGIEVVQFNPECGLIWKQEENKICGIPHYSGNVEILWYYQDSLHQKQSHISQLYINANPSKLWQNKPSNPTVPFYKQDNEHEYQKTILADVIGARVRGRSHAHVGSCCDDDFIIQAFEEENLYVLAVSDGAGSAEFSRYGSELVVRAIKQEMYDSLADFKNAVKNDILANKLMQRLVHSAYKALYHAVTSHSPIDGLELSLRKLYCTLLVALVFKQEDGKWLTIAYSVGDGVIAYYQPQSQGMVRILSQNDSGQFSGETAFLNHKSIMLKADGGELEDRISKLYITSHVPLLFLMTDGVSDPKFPSDESMKQVSYWKELWNELKFIKHEPNPAQALEEWLGFWSKGHHDDRTLVILLPKGFSYE